MMVGESGTSSSKGRKYHYYRCVNTKKHRTCDAKHKTVRKLPLENAVVNAVMAKIMDDNFVEYVADAVMDIQSRESSVLPALRKQMEEAESGITNMLNAIQMGIINASTKQRLDELEERKKDIELQIIQEEMKHPAVSREDVVYFVCRFRSLDISKLDARRRLIDSFVNAVTIFDDYILITFNYKEGETRIDFTDIESSDLQSVGGANITTKLENGKIHLRREVKRPWPFKPETINYSIGFAGWSRSVGAKTAREVLQKLKLYEEYPDYQDFLEGKEPMYQMVEQFEVPLRRLKDE